MKPRKINSGDSKIRILGFVRHEMDSREMKKAKAGRKKTRMYFDPVGENVIENLVARRFRPHNEYRKVAGDIFEKIGLDPEMKFHWDRYAGCAMCPCSPGFVLEGDFNHDIWVDYALPSQVREIDGFVIVNEKEKLAPEMFEGFVINGQVVEEVAGLTVTTTKEAKPLVAQVEGLEIAGQSVAKVSVPKPSNRNSKGQFQKKVAV